MKILMTAAALAAFAASASAQAVIVSTPTPAAPAQTIVVQQPPPPPPPPAPKPDEDKLGTKPGLELGARGEWYHPRGGTNRWSGGAQLRMHMTKNWALEAAGDYRRVGGADVYPLQGSLLIYLAPDSPVAPFILGGAGWYFVHGDQQRGSSDVWGPHAGAGLQFYLSNHWSIDGTYRHIWIVNHHNDPNNAAASLWSTEGNMVTAALNYRF